MVPVERRRRRSRTCWPRCAGSHADRPAARRRASRCARCWSATVRSAPADPSEVRLQRGRHRRAAARPSRAADLSRPPRPGIRTLSQRLWAYDPRHRRPRPALVVARRCVRRLARCPGRQVQRHAPAASRPAAADRRAGTRPTLRRATSSATWGTSPVSGPRCCSSPRPSARPAEPPAGCSATSPAVVPGVRHVEVDAEQHLDLVRRLGILRTPTTLVLDSARPTRSSRASGAPSRDAVLATLGRLVGD